MTDVEFDKAISTIYNTGMALPFIATGLPDVDPTISEMKYLRVLEILEKIQGLELTHHEKKDIQRITNLGDISQLRENLAGYWFGKYKKK